MFRFLQTVPMLLLGIAMLSACSSDNSPNAPLNGSIEKITGSVNGVYCVDLIAGKNIIVGQVCFEEVNTDWNITGNDHLRVTYSTTGGWEMTEVQFYIGLLVPPSAAPGSFPFVFNTWTSNETTFSFDIPFSYLTGLSGGDLYTCFTAMAHATVVNPGAGGASETAWGNGTPTGMNWSMSFPVCFEEDEDGGGGSGGGDPLTETAFAYNLSSTCFIPDFSRWGWTNAITAGQTYTYDLIAAAGQCDISKGVNVGEVTIFVNGTDATVEYSVIAPYSLQEIHFYVGTTPYPQVKQGKKWVSTVAPGQYPFVYGNGPYGSPASFNVTVPANSTHFIAHAVVGEF